MKSRRKIIFFTNAKKKVVNTATKIGEKVTSVIADIVFKVNGINKMSQSMSLKKKLLFNAINQEAGFDLTEEEMVKFKIWEKGIIPFFIDEYSFGIFFLI